ncbi:MAG: ribbon-helix-helix domain-containing protein [Caulobacteraceae bacterium]|nr:ribbon-helix-helix domain-containing protein [Caulobacter sp.]
MTGAGRLLRKRSLSLSGHATSLALEPEFWAVLERMAAARGEALATLVRGLDEARGARPLASACRLAALAFAQETASAADPPAPTR